MQIFISSSSKDHLINKIIYFALKNEEIRAWSSSVDSIAPGEDYSKVIFEEINKSKGAVLLVSQEYLDSPFIVEKELVEISLMKERNPDYKIFPVLLEKNINYENYGDIDISKIQYVNSKTNALNGLDQATHDVVIERLIKWIKESDKRKGNKITEKKILNLIDNFYQENMIFADMVYWLEKYFNDYKLKKGKYDSKEFKETLNYAEKELNKILDTEMRIKKTIKIDELSESQKKDYLLSKEQYDETARLLHDIQKNAFKHKNY